MSNIKAYSQCVKGTEKSQVLKSFYFTGFLNQLKKKSLTTFVNFSYASSKQTLITMILVLITLADLNGLFQCVAYNISIQFIFDYAISTVSWPIHIHHQVYHYSYHGSSTASTKCICL